MNKKQTCNGIVLLTDESAMKATHVGTLRMPSLLIKARIDCMFSTITKSLASTSAACDERGESIFMKKIHITYKGRIILKRKG